MTNAKATTEQMIRGQMGQPAACMIESKGVLAVLWGVACRSRGGGLWPMKPGHSPRGHRALQPRCRPDTGPRKRSQLSTDAVDKLVGKLGSAIQNWRCDSLCGPLLNI